MHGLIRVRQFTISEGHYILRPDQLEQEFKGCLELAKYFLDTVGLLENCTFRFSQWDPENKNNKYEGTKEQWEESQAVMKTILDDLDVDYEVGIDEAHSTARSLIFSTRMYSVRKTQLLQSRLICSLPKDSVCTTSTRTVRRSFRILFTELHSVALKELLHI